MGFASYFQQWDAQLRRKLGTSLLNSAASWRSMGLDPHGSLYYGRQGEGQWLVLSLRKGKVENLPWQRLAHLLSIFSGSSQTSPAQVSFQGQKVAGLYSKNGAVALAHQGLLWAFSSKALLRRSLEQKTPDKGSSAGAQWSALSSQDKPMLQFAAKELAGVVDSSPKVGSNWQVQPRALRSLQGSMEFDGGLQVRGKLHWNRQHFMGRRYSRILAMPGRNKAGPGCFLSLPGRLLFDFHWYLSQLEGSTRRLLVYSAAPVMAFWWQRGIWPSKSDNRVLHVLHTLSPYIQGGVRVQVRAYKRKLIYSLGTGVMGGDSQKWWKKFLAQLRNPPGDMSATVKALDSQRPNLVQLSLPRRGERQALRLNLYYDTKGERLWLWSPRLAKRLSLWSRVAQWRKCRQKERWHYRWAFYPKNLRYWARNTNDLFMLKQLLQGIGSITGSFDRIGESKAQWRFDLYVKPAR